MMPSKARFDAYDTPYHLIMGGKGLPWQDTGCVRRPLLQKLKQKTGEPRHAIDDIIRFHCTRLVITSKQLQGNNCVGQIPCIRPHRARALAGEPGLSYAEIARQLGVSHVAVLKMMKKEDFERE